MLAMMAVLVVLVEAMLLLLVLLLLLLLTVTLDSQEVVASHRASRHVDWTARGSNCTEAALGLKRCLTGSPTTSVECDAPKRRRR